MLERAPAHASPRRRSLHPEPSPETPTDAGRRLAHDFRNLLLVADTRVETAQLVAAELEAEGHTDLSASLQAARTAIAELRALTRLLDDVRLERRTASDALDLCALIAAAGRELQALMAPQVRVVVELPGDSTLWVRGNAPQLRRMIRNLGLNAREAMPRGGTLTLALHRRAGEASGCSGGACARLVVRDCGAGLAAEALARMFEPGFTTRAGCGGSGLGLAIVHEIAAAHGARIEVASRLGEGTEFCIDFPAMRSLRSPKRRIVRRDRGAADTVLAVSASPELYAQVRGALCHHTGALRLATTGREALRVLESNPRAVRCLVLDAGTVSADELALLRALRTWRGGRAVVLILPDRERAQSLIARHGESAVFRSRVAFDLAGAFRRALNRAG